MTFEGRFDLCVTCDDPAGVVYVEKYLGMWFHPSGEIHINKRRYLQPWGVLQPASVSCLLTL